MFIFPFLVTNEGTRYFAQTQKPFKGINFSIVNSGKEDDIEQYCLVVL